MDHFGIQLYQLQNEDGEDWGLIETDASKDTVEELWKRCWRGEFTEVEKALVDSEFGEDGGGDLQEMEYLLQKAGYYAEHKWVTDIKA